MNRGNERSQELRDFIRAVCIYLGHGEGASFCIKKLCHDNWLDTREDLRLVPRSRLEAWGLPLRLVHEIVDASHEMDASRSVAGFVGVLNYHVRPSLDPALSAIPGVLRQLRSDALRRRHPEVWAGRRIVRWWRTILQDRRRTACERADVAHAVSGRWLGLVQEDFKRPSAEEADGLRRQRALQTLRVLVCRWRFQRALGRGLHSREPKECEVTDLLRGFAVELRRGWSEVRPHAFTIVSDHWLETVMDLEIVEERHWEAWGVPEKLVQLLKAELERASAQQWQQEAKEAMPAVLHSWLGLGSAS